MNCVLGGLAFRCMHVSLGKRDGGVVRWSLNFERGEQALGCIRPKLMGVRVLELLYELVRRGDGGGGCVSRSQAFGFFLVIVIHFWKAGDVEQSCD